MKDYHINIFYSDEDNGYIADIPDLKHCSAFGKTAMEALSEVEIAKALWIETAKKEGKPIPAPKYTPIIYRIGGMFLLPISKHCPVKLHESLLDVETLKSALSRQ